IMSRIPADSSRPSISGVHSGAGCGRAARTRARSRPSPSTRREACLALANLLLAASVTRGRGVCAAETAASVESAPDAATSMDDATIRAILALDADRISAAEVRDVLARAPAPRVIALHGS